MFIIDNGAQGVKGSRLTRDKSRGARGGFVRMVKSPPAA